MNRRFLSATAVASSDLCHTLDTMMREIKSGHSEAHLHNNGVVYNRRVVRQDHI